MNKIIWLKKVYYRITSQQKRVFFTSKYSLMKVNFYNLNMSVDNPDLYCITSQQKVSILFIKVFIDMKWKDTLLIFDFFLISQYISLYTNKKRSIVVTYLKAGELFLAINRDHQLRNIIGAIMSHSLPWSTGKKIMIPISTTKHLLCYITKFEELPVQLLKKFVDGAKS